MLELQGNVETRDEKVRELMQNLADHDSEQKNVKHEAQMQTDELTEQIKMLQEQLLEVRYITLSCIFCPHWADKFTLQESCYEQSIKGGGGWEGGGLSLRSQKKVKEG